METLKAQRNELHQHFLDHGYVSIPSFLTDEQVADLNANLKRFKREVMPSMPAEQIYYEDKDAPSTLKQIQHLYEYDNYFKQMMFGSRFEFLAEILLNEKVIGKNMQYFNKPPQIGKPTPPHQDGYYFHIKPNSAITMWLALEDVDESTGCVRYVNGSHHYGLRAHGKTGTLGFSQGILDFPVPNDLKHEVAFPCKAGHLIAHHALTIHWADGNTHESRNRQAMGFIYYGESARVDERAAAVYQARLDAELATSGKI